MKAGLSKDIFRCSVKIPRKKGKKNISESKNPKGICQIMKRLSARSIHSYFKRGFVKNCNVTFSAELKYTETWTRNPWTHKTVQLSLKSRFTNYKLVDNNNKTRNNHPLIFPDSQLEALQFVLGLWRPRRYTLNPGGEGEGVLDQYLTTSELLRV